MKNTKKFLDLDGADLERELQKIIKENPARRNWSEKELEILRKLYRKVPILVIAEKLGKSYDAVQARGKRLKRI